MRSEHWCWPLSLKPAYSFHTLRHMDPSKRARELQTLEHDAEMLVVLQLDLLAQVERQVRAVHHTMRHIEKLRSAKSRSGRELTNGQKQSTLTSLADEITQIESHFGAEHTCCAEMQQTIATMQTRLAHLR